LSSIFFSISQFADCLSCHKLQNRYWAGRHADLLQVLQEFPEWSPHSLATPKCRLFCVFSEVADRYQIGHPVYHYRLILQRLDCTC
jgi:hypothetical protein